MVISIAVISQMRRIAQLVLLISQILVRVTSTTILVATADFVTVMKVV